MHLKECERVDSDLSAMPDVENKMKGRIPCMRDQLNEGERSDCNASLKAAVREGGQQQRR